MVDEVLEYTCRDFVIAQTDYGMDWDLWWHMKGLNQKLPMGT